MATESVQVFVRCRPANDREKELKSKKCIRVDKKALSIEIAKPSSPELEPKAFTFDGVYDDDSQQKTVYNDTAFRLVTSVIEGYNATMFAYGQTGCGKTHTMEGKPNPPEMRGIIPNAFDHIFSSIQQNTVKGKKFLVKASYIEIYNEEVRDLLGDDPKARLDVKENQNGTYIKGLTVNVVKDSAAIAALMVHGNKNRSVGATLMNQTSSRSHSLFMVEVETAEPDEKAPDSGEAKIRVGKLNLVDLAGSERQDKTGAAGDRLKEATQINKSLSALGNVIAALVRGKVHVPYRDSKLTRLLQSSLGGNTKTIMMAAISPAEDNYDETLSTLRYANRAKNIKNKPRINEDPKDALLREYQDEIKKLKAMLEAQAKGVPLQTLLDNAASQNKRASIRLKKTTTAGALVVDDDGPDADDFVADDDVEGHTTVGAPRRAGSANTAEAKLRKKQADELALRKAFEREKEWEETRAVVEQLRADLPALQKTAEEATQALTEAKASAPQVAGDGQTPADVQAELARRVERAEARAKAASEQYAAELELYKKLDAADKAMAALVKEQDATAAARQQLASGGSGGSDSKKREDIQQQLMRLDADRDDQERRANAVAAQMKQERTEHRRVADMYTALHRLAREKDEAERFEDERRRIIAAEEKKRADELGRELARLAKEKADQEKRVAQFAEQMAAHKTEKENLARLAAEKAQAEQAARESAERMKREMEAHHKQTLEARMARDRIEEENKERARQTEELSKKIAEEKEAHEKARLELAEKIRKQKEKQKQFAQQFQDEKKRAEMEKESLQSKLKQLEDTLLEGDKKSRDAKLQADLQLRHAQLLQQQREAELARAKVRAEEDRALLKDEYDSKVTDQKAAIARLKKKYKAALEELKDISAEHDEATDALHDTIRKLEREGQLRRQIITHFLTDKDYEKFVTLSRYDDAAGRWILPPVERELVFPKIGGTLSEGVGGGRDDDAPHGLPDLRAGSPSSRAKRGGGGDERWRQMARNRGRSVGIDSQNRDAGGDAVGTPGFDRERAGNRSAMNSRIGTASGQRDGGGNSGLSIVASRDAGRAAAPHSAYIPRPQQPNGRNGSAGPRVGSAGGADEPVDLTNLPQGRANFVPAGGAKPGAAAAGGSAAGGGASSAEVLANLPRPKPNFQPALGVPGQGSAANSAHNSAQNSEDDDEPVVARDQSAQPLIPNPPARPKFEAHPPPVHVQPASHLPDGRKRPAFEPARGGGGIHPSGSHGNISGMAENAHSPVDGVLNATSALRKKPAFQPAGASPAISPTASAASGAGGVGSHVADMNLPPSKASFQPAAGGFGVGAGGGGAAGSANIDAALNFQPKKASFQPAMPAGGGGGGVGGDAGFGGGGGGPRTPPRRVFQPASFGAMSHAADGHGPGGADPFKSLPSKPAFQPAAV